VVLDTCPTPHVLVAGVILGVLEDAGSRCPHSHTEDEPADSKESVVYADLFGSLVSSPAVTDKYDDADQKRYTGASENDLLGPCVGVLGPCWETAHSWESAGGVEDGE